MVGAAFACAASFGQAQGDLPKEVEANLVVDCLQPPSIRKLGPGRVLTMPGQLAKVTAANCKRRGGQFVPFDLADPPTALKIWLDAAEQGDDYAQFRVGQIYEMGGAGAPDFQAAAKWYTKASDQGNREAAKNLAALYAKGTGVKEDKAAADKLLRKAQGEKSAPPTSPVESAVGKPSIQLIDPSLIVTRGDMGEIPISGEIKSKQITGRVKPVDLASLKINGKDVHPDQYGMFQDTVPIAATGTDVTIVAVGLAGGRDEVHLRLRPAKLDATESPRASVRTASGEFGNYYALVIGNNAYRDWPELQTAIADANSVGELLKRKYGFKVTVLRNATYEQTLNSINDLVQTLTNHDNLVIYYAGHGYYDLGRRGYWIPVDAERDRNTRWILNVQITDLLLKLNARQVLVISDSCYSGALADAEKDVISTIPSGLTEEARLETAKHFSQVRSRRVLTSGAIAPVWDVSFGGHSLFAKALLEVLDANDSVLDGQHLFDNLEGRVIKASSEIREREERSRGKSPIAGDQTPVYAAIRYAGDQGGDFIFVPVAN
jgi:uncharacterized protein